MPRKASTKEKLVEASVTLFHTKGYDGTSVREIAQMAKVNVANIKYHFQNKRGLLEYLVQIFFEGYLETIEDVFRHSLDKKTEDVFLYLIEELLHYQFKNPLLARFVYREMTMDHTLIREVLSTYLMKEKYYFKSLIKQGMEENVFIPLNIPVTIIQLKGMLTMPFTNPHYVSEVHHIIEYEEEFIQHYTLQMKHWVLHTICTRNHDNFIISNKN